MKFPLTLFGIFAFVIFVFGSPHAWNFKTGKTFEGEFISSAASSITVKKDGKYFVLLISDLATNELPYLAGLQQQEEMQRAKINSLVQSIRVLDQPDGFGKCRIQTKTGIIKIRLFGLPKSIAEYYDNVKKLQAEIDTQTACAERLRLVAKRAEANVPDVPTTVFSGGYYSDFYAFRTSEIDRRRTLAKNLAVDADTAEASLKKLQAKLAELKSGLIEITTLNAYPTGQNYFELPCWQVKP